MVVLMVIGLGIVWIVAMMIAIGVATAHKATKRAYVLDDPQTSLPQPISTSTLRVAPSLSRLLLRLLRVANTLISPPSHTPTNTSARLTPNPQIHPIFPGFAPRNPQPNILLSQQTPQSKSSSPTTIWTLYRAWLPGIPIPTITIARFLSETHLSTPPSLLSYLFITFGAFHYVDTRAIRFLQQHGLSRIAGLLSLFYAIGCFVVGLFSVYSVFFVASSSFRFLWLLVTGMSTASTPPSHVIHPFLVDTMQPANILFRSEQSGRWLTQFQQILRQSFTYSTFPLEPTFDSRLATTPASSTLKNAGIVSSSIIPGVTVPVYFIPYLLLAFTISGAFHELGHATAAISGDIPVHSFGTFFILAFPAAFVEIDSIKLKTTSFLTRFKVLYAGIWHNIVLAMFTLVTLFLLPSMLSAFYQIGHPKSQRGVIVLNVDESSPLYPYFTPGDTIFNINGYDIESTIEGWESAIMHSMQESNLGFCVDMSKYGLSEKYFRNHHSGKSILRTEDFGCCKYYELGSKSRNKINPPYPWTGFSNVHAYFKGERDDDHDVDTSVGQCYSTYSSLSRRDISEPINGDEIPLTVDRLKDYACVPYTETGANRECTFNNNMDSTGFKNLKFSTSCTDLGPHFECLSPLLPKTDQQSTSTFLKTKKLMVFSVRPNYRTPPADRLAKVGDSKLQRAHKIKGNEKRSSLDNIASGLDSGASSWDTGILKVSYIGDPSHVWASVRVGTLFPKTSSESMWWHSVWFPYAIERFLVMLLSVTLSLALFNLLPVPTFDGRELVRCGLEFILTINLVRRRRLYGLSRVVQKESQRKGSDSISSYSDDPHSSSSVDVYVASRPGSGIMPSRRRMKSDTDNFKQIIANSYDTSSISSADQSNADEYLLSYGTSLHASGKKSSWNIITQYFREWWYAIKVANKMPTLSDKADNGMSRSSLKFDETLIYQQAERIERVSCISLTIILGLSAILSLIYV